MISVFVDLPNRDKDIKPRVVEKLKAITDMDDAAENEISSLEQDLGMGSTLRKAMGVPYTKISKSYPSGLIVSLADAGNCKTVKDSIDLVYNRAIGGKK
jgi:hypothetical protein